MTSRVYRFLCLFCLAGFATSYLHLISWRLPVTGFIVFGLVWKLQDSGLMIFIASYPILLYLNQYPELQVSAATFLVIAAVLGLSLRRPAQLWLPMAILTLYLCIGLFRYRPDLFSVIRGIWTTDQMSPTLFVGAFVTWAAAIMLFDFLRQTKSSLLYRALIIQGALFAAMSVANLWFRQKSVLEYQFLFGDVHAFAAYLVLQIGLLAGLCRLTKWQVVAATVACVLFVIYSMLLAASYSRTGFIAYFTVISLYLAALVIRWIYQKNLKGLLVATSGLLVVFGLFIKYGPDELIAKSAARLNDIYLKVEPVTPSTVKREVISRIVYLRHLFVNRTDLISFHNFYTQRMRNWPVPLEMIRDYPLFGIGIGEFYRNSAVYSKRVPSELYSGLQYPENAHNYYLQIAAETGLIGILLFIVLLAWLFGKHWKIDDPVKLACGLGLAGLVIFGFAQHPLLVDRVFFVSVMISALMCPAEKHGEELIDEYHN